MIIMNQNGDDYDNDDSGDGAKRGALAWLPSSATLLACYPSGRILQLFQLPVNMSHSGARVE